MLIGDSVPLGLTIDEYVLISGVSRIAAPERAMLTALGESRETLGEFIERLGADELPYELVEPYLDAGALAAKAFYPALANLRRAHDDGGSLVRRARAGLARRIRDDPAAREEWTYVIDRMQSDSERREYWEAAMRAYIISLTPANRERFHATLLAVRRNP